MSNVVAQLLLQAKGRVYYIDRATFPDAQLLERLTPLDPSAVAAAEYIKQHSAATGDSKDV